MPSVNLNMVGFFFSSTFFVNLTYLVLPLHSLASSVRFVHEERLGNARETVSVTSEMGHLEEVS